MIFLIFNEFLSLRNGHPPIAKTETEFDKLPLRWKYDCDYIFEVKDGKTIYYKNRYKVNKQLTSEELLILSLKAVVKEVLTES